MSERAGVFGGESRLWVHGRNLSAGTQVFFGDERVRARARRASVATWGGQARRLVRG